MILQIRGPTGSSRPVSADDAQGKPWGAAAPHKPGDLMPVDAVGVNLGQRPRDTQTCELRYAPGMHEQPVVVDGLLAGGGRFHRSSPPAGGVVLNGAGSALPEESDTHRVLFPVACLRASRRGG